MRPQGGGGGWESIRNAPLWKIKKKYFPAIWGHFCNFFSPCPHAEPRSLLGFLHMRGLNFATFFLWGGGHFWGFQSDWTIIPYEIFCGAHGRPTTMQLH